MVIKGKTFTIKQLLCLMIYYSILRYLPVSYSPIVGGISKRLRYLCCKHIFKYCGENVNIERKAFFGSGIDLCVGDNSGIGINCVLPGDTIIGQDVMMGPNCYIFGANHSFERTDIPMINQGISALRQTKIEDDVWIGRDVMMTPGRTIKRGSIIASGCVLCKDFPEYSIVGGNPSKLIRSRLIK
jgi:maltose O-acetyltransferase